MNGARDRSGRREPSRFAVALLVLGLLLVLGWVLGAGAAPAPESQVPVASVSPAPPPVDAAESGGPAPIDRVQSVPAAAAPDGELHSGFAFTLRCRVVDVNGLAVPQAPLLVAPLDCALDEWPQDDGPVTELRWPARVASMRMALGVVDRSLALREVQLRAGEVSEFTLLADIGGTKAACRRGQPLGVLHCGRCHGERVPADAGCNLSARGQRDECVFGDDLATEAPGGDGTWEDLPVVRHRVFWNWEHTGLVQGTVLDAERRPAPEQTVSWAYGDEGQGGITVTDASGRFGLAQVPWGVPITVRAGGGRAGLATTTLRSDQGPCTLQLERGTVQRGRAFGEGGAPLVGWHVEFCANDGSCDDADEVDADGVFELANLPPGPGTLLLWSGDGHMLPMALQTGVVPGECEVRFDLRTAPAASAIRLVAGRPPQIAEQPVEACFWQQDSGRGVRVAATTDGAVAISGLRAGSYRVQLRCPGCGTVEVGSVWVDGRTALDLGCVPLPVPGELRLVHRPEGLELYRRRPDLDVRALPYMADRLLLPAGDWLAVWREGEQVRVRGFDTRGGCENVVEFAAAGR